MTGLLTTMPGASLRSALICDDRPPVAAAIRSQLSTGLDSLPAVRVVADPAALLQALDRSLPGPADGDRREVVFVGAHRASSTGIDAVRVVRDGHPATPVLVFGAAADAQFLAAAVAAGASGVLVLNPARPRHHGISTTTAPRPGWWRTQGGGQSLTERESRVLWEITKGRSNAEIGRELLLSPDTIKKTVHRTFLKLGARDRAHAVATALRNGLLP